ncbi:MAG: nucleoside hydrolase [Planctomycetota bacterium]|jgi:inosine-uridine nucleoside N-ribohydrolase
MSEAEILKSIQFRTSVLPLLVLGSLALFLVTLSSCATNNNSPRQKTLHSLEERPQCKKIPVILDTDIGDDIDDTWALALLLQSPEFDIKLITTAVGDTLARAKVVAKFLEVADRADIPVGIGLAHAGKGKGHNQDEWVRDYKLSSYPGTIYQDGVQALIDTIMNSPEPITVIAIGPLPNIAAALEREPGIAEKAEYVGMQGSVRRGYEGRKEISKEYNVVTFVKDAQKVFTSDWDMTITPLDTCGIVWLKGEKYQKVLKSKNPLARAIIENYRVWTKSQGLQESKVDTGSSTLYDTVAVYLAISTKLVKMEKLGIRVTDDGYTVIDNKAKAIDCAAKWKDLDAFEDFLVERLTK